MKKLLLINLCFAIASVSGCGGIPKDALSMNKATLEDRQLQTRIYDTDRDYAPGHFSLTYNVWGMTPNQGYKLPTKPNHFLYGYRLYIRVEDLNHGVGG